MSDHQPEQGHVYYADLGLRQRKRLLVVSGDDSNLNPSWLKVICVYLTTKHVAIGPWVATPSHGGGTVANCTELFAIAKRRLGEEIEPALTDGELSAVYEGIALALGAEGFYRQLYG